MKQFEINAMGLSECTLSENAKINGGGPIGDYIFGKLVDYLLDKTVEVIVDGFRDGTYADWYSSMYENNPIYCPLR